MLCEKNALLLKCCLISKLKLLSSAVQSCDIKIVAKANARHLVHTVCAANDKKNLFKKNFVKCVKKRDNVPKN